MYIVEISILFVQALETGRKGRLWRVFLTHFATSENNCTYIVFILQCQKVQNNCQILLKRTETGVVLIIFTGVLSCQCSYCFCFLPLALHESGTCARKVLLGSWLNNTKVYLSPLLVLKIARLHDKKQSLYLECFCPFFLFILQFSLVVWYYLTCSHPEYTWQFFTGH